MKIRKNFKKALAIKLVIFAITLSFFTACQPTPETEVVVGKGEDAIEEIIEKAEPLQEYEEEEQQLILLEYDAPEHLEYDIEGETVGAAMKIKVNADIVLPEYTLPLVTVAPKDIDYEQISAFIELVRNGRELYHSQYANRIELKKDIQQVIDNYLWEISVAGDRDTTFYKNRIQELYAEMELAVETYADADIQPETSAPDTYYEDEDGTIIAEPAPEGTFVLTEEYIGPFNITQENYKDESYNLIIGEGYDADSLYINAVYGNDIYQRIEYLFLDYEGLSAKGVMAKVVEGIMDGFGMSEEDAIETAEPYVQAIDSSLTLVDISPATYTDYSSDENTTYPYGYVLYYARQYCGVNTNYAEEFSYYIEFLEDQGEYDMYQTEYPQEYLIITVGEKGVQSLEYTSPLEVVETISQNVELLPFEQIKEKFEQYIVYNDWNSENTLYMNIEKIQLGLMRIAQPNSDEYLIVPVWDFYGSAILSSDSTTYTDDEYWEKISHFYNRSFLTINAVDGSIINRELGY